MVNCPAMQEVETLIYCSKWPTHHRCQASFVDSSTKYSCTGLGTLVNYEGFNVILSLENREMGTQVQDYEIKDFREFTEECNISKLPAVGRYFTWTNGHMYSRIDKALVNVEWLMNMPLS